MLSPSFRCGETDIGLQRMIQKAAVIAAAFRPPDVALSRGVTTN
jgi:hypothetical protein